VYDEGEAHGSGDDWGAEAVKWVSQAAKAKTVTEALRKASAGGNKFPVSNEKEIARLRLRSSLLTTLVCRGFIVGDFLFLARKLRCDSLLF
jgi:hypothetical protein